MLRHTFAMLGMLAAAGCASSNTASTAPSADNTLVPSSPTELAAFAGHARLPDTQPTDDLKVAAVVSRDKRTIKIYNFGTDNLRELRVWVNGSYVKPIGGIAPQSSVIISTNELYNGLGHSLGGKGEEVSRVQLQTADHLYNLMGPATE